MHYLKLKKSHPEIYQRIINDLAQADAVAEFQLSPEAARAALDNLRAEHLALLRDVIGPDAEAALIGLYESLTEFRKMTFGQLTEFIIGVEPGATIH